MSYYGIGAEPLIDIWTPGDALDDMRSIDGGIRSLGEAVAASTVSAKFKAEYAIFQGEWRAFYDDHVGSVAAYISRGRHAFKKRLENYQALLLGWRSAFEKEGGLLSSVPTHNMPTSKAFPWGWAIGIIGVGLLAYKAFSSSDDRTVRFRIKE